MSDRPTDGIGILLISAVVAGFLLLSGYLLGVSDRGKVATKGILTPRVSEQCLVGSVDDSPSNH